MNIFDTYSVNTYLLLHFEHKNDVAVVVKHLYKATNPQMCSSVKFDN